MPNKLHCISPPTPALDRDQPCVSRPSHLSHICVRICFFLEICHRNGHCPVSFLIVNKNSIRLNIQRLCATEEAYSRAIELYKKAYPNNKTTLSKLQGKYKIGDVVDAVAAAKEKYDQRTKDSKARKWLSYFSSQVTYYGQVLDVLAQHHPEYVSLAWGTMKFVFIVSASARRRCFVC